MNFLMEEMSTYLDAFDIYSLFKEDKTVTFLDSGIDHNNLGRYSFIGINVFSSFKYEDNKCFIDGKVVDTDEPFEAIKRIMKNYKINNNTRLPYIGGAMGYFSYDLGRILENIPKMASNNMKIPEVYLYFYDNAIIKDNLENKIYITALGILKDSKESIKHIKERISRGNKITYTYLEGKENKFEANFTKEDYLASIDKLREYIENGDVYIANLTQSFSCETNKSPYAVYKELRYINPSPFAAFLNIEDFSIISSSPERFLKIKDKIIETRPIKGTRPRGRNASEDLKNAKTLVESEKDKSELLMIVDLERNDLSKVCNADSVKVTELFKLEKYSTVFHLVSTITGVLKDELTALDCLKACFPGGSITGAPKIRAMEIIEELEPTRRNLYTGCIGYLGFDGNMDLNIAIRTIVIKDKKAYFGVGGGITWESIREDEYQETLDKAKALMRCLS
ncbi:aminodeoxychorismate synthase component I [Clostridium pasteurianum]|uniref:Anthranilate synthase component 1 n=1 Tax=Clostridium pasteurianum BC1 TaxID=86416 RepID=R4KB17_CLOPA|nr:aminodeoxychorismate synthase component I [Clostridium pasteurianum]AGK97714.1 aminodeoxychorismate synthase, component I [Clostridium pasteurianum BC1]